MSHIVTFEKQINDTAVLERAARNMEGATVLGEGRHTLYASSVDGFAVKLPGWTYPVVVQKDGTVKFDNYNGHWGNRSHLDALMQAYGVEKVKASIRQARVGAVARQVRLADGTIRLVVQA